MVVEFPDGTPMPDLDLQVCRNDDVECAALHDAGTSDADGMLQLRVPTDAPVYYEVSGETVPTFLHFRRVTPPPTTTVVRASVASALVACCGSITGTLHERVDRALVGNAFTIDH